MTITSTPRWSLSRGNAVVPSRWQATGGLVWKRGRVGHLFTTRPMRARPTAGQGMWPVPRHHRPTPTEPFPGFLT